MQWKSHGDLQAFRGAPWRYGTTGSLCGELSLWSGAHGREMSWKPQPTNCSIGMAPNERSCLLFLGHFFCHVYIILFMFPLCGRSTLCDTSARHFCDCWDSWSPGDTTPVWSCQQVVSRAWEVEKPWLKDEVFGSLDVVFSVGATNVAPSRFVMEIKLTYWTIPATIYPHLIFHKVAHEKNSTKNTRIIGRIPSSLWTSSESLVTWISRVVLSPFVLK